MLKVREMSFSHSPRLNADQPPKIVVFTRIIRIIALVSMISGLLSFVLPFIFDFVARLMSPLEFLVLPSGPVAALVGVALGLLSLLLGAYDTKTCILAIIGLITGVVFFFMVWIFFAYGGGIPLWRG